MVRQQKIEEVEDKAKENAEERLIDVFVPPPKKSTNPLGSLFSSQEDEPEEKKEEPPKYQAGREWMRKRLRSGELENDVIEVEVEESARPMGNMFAGSSLEGMSDNLQSMIGKLVPKNRHKRKVTVAQARKIFAAEEADKLVDMDVVAEEAVRAAEYSGIVFLDEIDKVAVSNGRSAGADISREGVQRDILPIVEGSTVVTKYGPVKTDHVLFIAAGAFHTAKPSDLIPELQGRFPIRVELKSLVKEDFERILTEPRNALIKQYSALLGVEGVSLRFADDAVSRLAQLAETVNEQTEDIGARRLYTLLEKLLEELSFDAPDLTEKEVVIDAAYVDRCLADIAGDHDVSRFIL